MDLKLKLISSIVPRTYQQTIFANSIHKNTFIILPTGLGKTLIALMVSIYFFNNNSSKKILFLAPTRPLIEQQKKVFEDLIENSNKFNFLTLTGSTPPKKREQLYTENQFIFSTPQVIENDIINNILDINEISLCIFDEGHRATGNYSYCFIAETLYKTAHIISLSASPASSKQEIRQVLQNLYCENIEVRSYDDYDIKKYVNKTKIEYSEVELTQTLKQISNLLKKAHKKQIENLKKLVGDKISLPLTRQSILDIQKELRVKIATEQQHTEIWQAISLTSGMMKLLHGLELVESQEISCAYKYFYNIFRLNGDGSKAAKLLQFDVDVRNSFELLSKLCGQKIVHPKIDKLKNILAKEFKEKKDIRIIIFSQYRDTSLKIVEVLKEFKEIKPSQFIGQARKNEISMTQKEQKEILQKFRCGEINVLVSTSVGEEGLDIPKVDCVIFYEPVPSAIRTIQRIGRTGRFDVGKAYILISKGTRDVAVKYVASAKEKRMYKAISEIKRELERKEGLQEFIKEEQEIKKIDSRPLIYIDLRENNDLLKLLHKSEEVQVQAKKLEVGDCVISEYTAIERKTKLDFVNSILNKQIFKQLIDLARNYSRPILILEGRESIYMQRNVNPNVIRASLGVVAIELRIPIIETSSLEETKNILISFAKRVQKKEKMTSPIAEKKFSSQREELEKVISMIPKINIVTARNLLEKFGTIKNLTNKKQKDFEKVKGVGRKRAEFLEEFFRRKYDKLIS